MARGGMGLGLLISDWSMMLIIIIIIIIKTKFYKQEVMIIWWTFMCHHFNDVMQFPTLFLSMSWSVDVERPASSTIIHGALKVSWSAPLMCVAESNNERFISEPTHQTFMAAESRGVAVNTHSPASPCDITLWHHQRRHSLFLSNENFQTSKIFKCNWIYFC